MGAKYYFGNATVEKKYTRHLVWCICMMLEAPQSSAKNNAVFRQATKTIPPAITILTFLDIAKI